MKLFYCLAGIAISKNLSGRSCESNCDSQNRDCVRDCRTGDLQCISSCQRNFDKCLQECRGNQIHFVAFNPERDAQSKVSWYYQSQDSKDETVVPRNLSPSYSNRKYMCTFKVNGEFHLIGGRSDTDSSIEYRHFRMEPNQAVALDQLPFAFRAGACTDYKSGTSSLACGSSNNAKGCWKYDGLNWEMVGSTQRDHFNGDLASFQGGAIIVGGYRDRTGSTEFFDESETFSKQWQVKGETAEFEQYDDFEAVEIGDFVWSFGGNQLRANTPNVFKMNSSFVWERHHQSMGIARSGHRVVKDGERAFIIGGVGDLPAEMWEYAGGSDFNIYFTQTFKTSNERSFAELMVVDKDW